MFSPRFVLVLSAQSNLLGASLVTRDSRTAASARQTFHLIALDNVTKEFDPAEVWYNMKKVIEACLDIGRTLSRDIAGVAIVDETNARVVWSQQGDEIDSSGILEPRDGIAGRSILERATETEATLSGTLAAWLVWNLTGKVASADNTEWGDTRVRSPFDAELPVVTVLNTVARQLSECDAHGRVDRDWVLKAAEVAWQKLDR